MKRGSRRSRLGLLFVFLSWPLIAASCEERLSYAEFTARGWSEECSTDRDCVLLPIPCDHCGGQRSLSSREASAYAEVSATVDCADYTLDQEIDCGSRVAMEPACSAGRCSARVAAPPDEPDEPSVAPPNACDGLRARAASLLASAPAACRVDGDCGCYPAFVDCGGVRDATSAAAFGEIAAQGQAAGCGYVDGSGSSFNCSPWECIPACANGICQRGSRPR